MKILVTGTEGYIGCRLAPILLADGPDGIGLEPGACRDGHLFTSPLPARRLPALIQKDLRQLEPSDLEGIEAIVHLAELSNDPLGENNPELTYRINHQGSVRLAELALLAGVQRFVYASSCSVYGVGTD